ncbi:MAG TPA: ATP-binding protein, partial [Roseiflexaceae bacterium]|nr:ATP-binding protein [Roseiflexaceae bacterium]
TARKQFEHTLREQNLELERASLAKDRFLASMSHELRTPLNAIIGFTGTLLMRLPGPLTHDQERQLATVQSSAKHLLALINDLLDLAKIESGRVELRLESVVGQAVIDEVAANLRPLAEGKGLRFELQLPDQPMVLRTDRRALSQILINLLNNAIKFTDQGGVRLTLARREERGRAATAISVSDTGIGMRPEDQAHLFEAYMQGRNPSTRPHEGTGLGLHLSQKLAGLLGGAIEFVSEYGHGSTFTLVIPEK